MVAGQRIQVGIGHAGETVTVPAEGDRFQIHNNERLQVEVARTTVKPDCQIKARKPERLRSRAHNSACTPTASTGPQTSKHDCS